MGGSWGGGSRVFRCALEENLAEENFWGRWLKGEKDGKKFMGQWQESTYVPFQLLPSVLSKHYALI